jgi:hypothetical protein
MPNPHETQMDQHWITDDEEDDMQDYDDDDTIED